METARGLLVALEGIDAVGKRTQSARLVSWLSSKGVRTGSLSFPDYTTPIGKEIRGYLDGVRHYSVEVGHMLYAVNRWEAKGEIQRLLSSMEVLVVNRYSPSNFAYGTANGLSLDWLEGLERGLPNADLVLVLDAPSASLSSRRGFRKDKYERDTRFQESVREAYLSLAKKHGWVVVDAAQGIHNTSQLIANAVDAAIRERARSH